MDKAKNFSVCGAAGVAIINGGEIMKLFQKKYANRWIVLDQTFF